MNTLQCARQIRFKLLARTWPDSPAGAVFAGVYVSQGPAEDLAPTSLRFPFALVRVLDGVTDADDQRYQVQRFEVVPVVQAQGDQVGEFAMIGGHRPSQGRSSGRGLLEVEEQVLQALQFLDQLDGVRLQLVSVGAAEAGYVPEVGYVAYRPMQFQARLTTDRSYPTPNAGRALGASAAGGTATLTWTWHERFDIAAARTEPATLTTARGKLALVRTPGVTAPAAVNNVNGTTIQVTLASNAATTASDTPQVSGTYSYALFAQYDEFGDAVTVPLGFSIVSGNVTGWSLNFRTKVGASVTNTTLAESIDFTSAGTVAGSAAAIANAVNAHPTLAAKVSATVTTNAFYGTVVAISLGTASSVELGYLTGNLGTAIQVRNGAELVGTSVRTSVAATKTGVVI